MGALCLVGLPDSDPWTEIPLDRDPHHGPMDKETPFWTETSFWKETPGQKFPG